MPYTPILNIAHVLKSTLYLVEHTEYPHKGSPALEHAKYTQRDAIEAIHELEQLQAEIAGKPITIADATRPIGSLKTAWQSAKRRTQRHCPQCGTGTLVDEEVGGYVCESCGVAFEQLPEGLIRFRLHDCAIAP